MFKVVLFIYTCLQNVSWDRELSGGVFICIFAVFHIILHFQ